MRLLGARPARRGSGDDWLRVRDVTLSMSGGCARAAQGGETAMIERPAGLDR